MPTQAERQNYNWRPNDNSSTTNLRYDLEMDKWMTAYKNNERKHKPSSISADLNVIGLVFSLVFSLITLLVVMVIDFIKWLKS